MTIIHPLGGQSFVNNTDLHAFLENIWSFTFRGKGVLIFLQLHLNIDACLAASNLISIKEE